MEGSVRGIFSTGFEAWSRDRRVPLHYRKAAFSLAHCRTRKMGTHVQRCVRGGYLRIEPNSCPSRSCPRCSALARERWVCGQQAKLLSCDHYHVVFTLPHELLPWFSRARRLMVDVLFQSVRETLMTLLSESRFLGAEPGVLMALHTWGRNLSHHPHIHCLVSGGGLSSNGHWRSLKTPYLLPVRLVKALYRGKVLGLLHEAVKTGELKPGPGESEASLHGLLGRLRGKDWHVRLKERYAHGEGVMKYLARYVKGGPITDHRSLKADETHVRFRYRDHRDGKRKSVRLATGDFIGRLLWHLPEPHQHLIRTAGLYANRAGAKRARCREVLGQCHAAVGATLTRQGYLRQRGYAGRARCPVCGSALEVPPRRRQNQISYQAAQAVAVSVQQPDGADIACVPRPP